MRIPDANVLIYSVNSSVPQHATARSWLDDSLNATETVGFAWVALLAFLRITTRPGILPNPLSIAQATSVVSGWLSAGPAQVTHPTDHHHEVLAALLLANGTGGNLTSDAHLAALALEHGAELWSFDGDFERFTGLAFRRL